MGSLPSYRYSNRWIGIESEVDLLGNPLNESQTSTAGITHLALYAIILLMPVTGGLAWFAGIETMAEVHGAGKLAIVVLVGLHIAGALYQHFVLKTDAMRRILRPQG